MRTIYQIDQGFLGETAEIALETMTTEAGPRWRFRVERDGVLLASGDVIARVAEPNRQRAWGADVVARIESTIAQPSSLVAMREAIHMQLDVMLTELQRQTGLAELPVVHVCGNTTMLHLFEGADLRGLGSVPFSPVFLDARETTLGPRRLPARLVSGISAFVGADNPPAKPPGAVQLHAILADLMQPPRKAGFRGV